MYPPSFQPVVSPPPLPPVTIKSALTNDYDDSNGKTREVIFLLGIMSFVLQLSFKMYQCA